MDIIVGILLIVLGLAVCGAGIKYWFALLPVIAFVAGFTAGMNLMWRLFGGDNPFLEYTTGFIVGLVVGAVLAGISYAYWYIGAILGAAWSGAAVGAGIVGLISDDLGLLMLIFALAGALIFAAVTIALALPVYMVVFNTAIAGAMAAVGGVLLMFTDISHNDLGNGALYAAIEESWFWVLVVVVLAAGGIGAQLRMMASVVLPEDKYSKAAAA
jgi:hypothetical protein